jgi:hypothetical protein
VRWPGWFFWPQASAFRTSLVGSTRGEWDRNSRDCGMSIGGVRVVWQDKLGVQATRVDRISPLKYCSQIARPVTQGGLTTRTPSTRTADRRGIQWASPPAGKESGRCGLRPINAREAACTQPAAGISSRRSISRRSISRRSIVPAFPRPVPVAESPVIPHGVREPSRIILVFRRVMTALRPSIVFIDDSSRLFSPFGSFHPDRTRSHVPAGL